MRMLLRGITRCRVREGIAIWGQLQAGDCVSFCYGVLDLLLVLDSVGWR